MRFSNWKIAIGDSLVKFPRGRERILNRIVTSLLVIATLLIWWMAGGALLTFGAPKTKISCLAENRSETFLDAKTGEEQEVDNWTASCSILEDGHILYASTPLVLPYHASFREAMEAIDLFRSKTANKIIKELKSK